MIVLYKSCEKKIIFPAIFIFEKKITISKLITKIKIKLILIIYLFKL